MLEVLIFLHEVVLVGVNKPDYKQVMHWLQGAIWSNTHVRESIAAMQAKRPGSFTPLSPLQSFKELD